MTLSRFYCPGEIFTGRAIELPAGAAHHAFRVLRLEQGANVILFNGNGGEFLSVIVRIGRNGATVVPEKHLDIERESQLAITLAQAVCASEKMDWIIQKAVELGVNRIQPLATKLSMIRLSGERAERRMSHWQQVAISACEQCGRNHIPQVLPLEPLHNWLGTQASDRKNSVSPDSRFMLSPVAKNALRDFPRSSADAAITLLIGPEGGFTPDEEAAAKVAGFVPLQLGGRILRTETAALATVAAMQTLWGDY
ncbi:16S rRNA (uracil(1498)-N(3))-methyltransferase [Nitrosovibrio sp. Nv4]|uniref:16S rRNA (uracil(1498)-N(3))-methyltransferase n=1 Tax=Nitrosovibrio sp. Nv4 TaxID=1945880 RepID=UPI000BD83CCD|nr:16S rRNA (uracil(1498)-N(3))-methyltransferase [Nitrosovibrio sp. Nv4]SOD40600.1 16S rRNA (uracil1498-N3)-methyltransferase [Nitrosovibrio sp. Nv4]